jgi:hypothetical protein
MLTPVQLCRGDRLQGEQVLGDALFAAESADIGALKHMEGEGRKMDSGKLDEQAHAVRLEDEDDDERGLRGKAVARREPQSAKADKRI